MKLNWTIKTFLIVVVITTIVFFIRMFFSIKHVNMAKEKAGEKDVYYDRYRNIILSGKIIKKTSLDNDRYSLYEIDVAKSTIEHHDLRDSAKDFFLVIDGEKAQMVYNLSYDIFENDSVEVNYGSRYLYVYRKGILTHSFTVPSFVDYYVSMRKKAFGR
jgi:hypothetical protein